MRVAIKVLMIPLALLSSLLSMITFVIGGWAAWTVRLVAGFLWFSVMCVIVGGLWMNGSVDWTLAISVAAITTVVTLVAVFIETIPAALSMFSAWVWSL
jgi:hypothetical protein